MPKLTSEFGEGLFRPGGNFEGSYVQANGVVFLSQDHSGRGHDALTRDIRLHGGVKTPIEDKGRLVGSHNGVTVFSEGKTDEHIPSFENTVNVVREHTPPSVPVEGVMHTPAHTVLRYR